MQERFVKVGGRTFLESELREMNEKQLRSIINECQSGIEEIERKSEDYKKNNYDENNLEHYNQVVGKFKAASIYLQTDIILLNNIIKDIQPSKSERELQWYKEYFHIINASISRRKKTKASEIVSEKLGYSL